MPGGPLMGGNSHDLLDGGLGSSYEENSNSSPFDMPSDIMSRQFSQPTVPINRHPIKSLDSDECQDLSRYIS